MGESRKCFTDSIMTSESECWWALKGKPCNGWPCFKTNSKVAIRLRWGAGIFSKWKNKRLQSFKKEKIGLYVLPISIGPDHLNILQLTPNCPYLYLFAWGFLWCFGKAGLLTWSRPKCWKFTLLRQPSGNDHCI